MRLITTADEDGEVSDSARFGKLFVEALAGENRGDDHFTEEIPVTTARQMWHTMLACCHQMCQMRAH